LIITLRPGAAVPAGDTTGSAATTAAARRRSFLSLQANTPPLSSALLVGQTINCAVALAALAFIKSALRSASQRATQVQFSESPISIGAYCSSKWIGSKTKIAFFIILQTVIAAGG